MEKTIKIFNDENVKLNIELIKVENVSWNGIDASFKVDQIDRESGTLLESETYTIKNVLPGVDVSEDAEIFFEDKELDGDDYDWEIPEEMEEEFNEWLNDRYTECFDDYEEILSETHINELKKEIGFNKFLYYIDNNSVDFLPIKFDKNGDAYIDDDDIEKVYDLNLESDIFKYKDIYFDFNGYINECLFGIYFNILERTNEKKKVTKHMVENYGISSLTYDLVGKYVYMYEPVYTRGKRVITRIDNIY